MLSPFLAAAVVMTSGLADRAADANDGRQSIITVSDAGRRALGEARAVKQDWLAERLTSQFSQDEQGVLAEAVTLLQRIVDPRAGTPPGGPS